MTGERRDAASTEQHEARRLCTIAASRDLPFVILLAQSFARHHPEIPITALLVDATPGDFLDGLPFEALTPEVLPLDGNVMAQMATYYRPSELAAALKPFLLQHLLDAGGESVMYLAPDIEVFAPLDDLFALAEHGIVLTPHVIRPPAAAAAAGLEEETFLLRGQFNLGFVTVGPQSRPFLDYLSNELRFFALEDPEHGYFLDQRWADAVPTYFSHTVVRDATCNVGCWNLHERLLELDARGRRTVDGRPLRFVHLSGGSDEVVADALRFGLTDPKARYHPAGTSDETILVRFEQHPTLRQLLRGRTERLQSLGWTADGMPYRWGRSDDGVELTDSVRRAYWRATRDAHAEGFAPPPPAFGSDQGRGFSTWLREPATPGSRVTRHVYALWTERPELQDRFPDPLSKDSGPLADWARESASVTATTRPVLQTEEPTTPEPLMGVNFVGYLDGDFGVAAAGRMVARMVRASGVPLATTVLRTSAHKHRHHYPVTLEGTPFPVSLFAMNADALLGYSQTPGFSAHHDVTRVGIWYWEVGVFPEALRPALDLVDQVWCASDHVLTALAGWADGKVRKHPLVIEAPTRPTALLRDDLRLPPDRFLFGFAFDYLSVLRRKNPVGLIEAYRRAFGPQDGTALVLKTINAVRGDNAAVELRAAAGDREDIIFFDDHLDDVQMRSFFALLDCYVSLHRSEGLGLTIAAAMASGTPVVATGWSGNLEFMTSENSILVPSQLVDVGPGAYPYPVDACWAEPDLDVASDAMRRLYDDPQMAQDLGRRGASSVTTNHSVETAAAWFAEAFSGLSRMPGT